MWIPHLPFSPFCTVNRGRRPNSYLIVYYITASSSGVTCYIRLAADSGLVWKLAVTVEHAMYSHGNSALLRLSNG